MRYIKFALLAAAALFAAGCTEESDKTYPVHPTPQWNVAAEDFVGTPPTWTAAEASPVATPEWSPLFIGDAQAPQWNDPDKAVYPTSMTAVVRLTPILETLADDGDMMAAFIGDECRGVAQTVRSNGARLFFLHVKAPSSENGNVELRYYSAAARRIYTSVAADVKYEIDKIYGTADNPAYPDFEQSGPFPVATKAWVRIDSSTLPFEPGAGDELQAFVGDECRGIKHVANGSEGLYWFDLLGKAAGESVYFKYYSAEQKQVYVSEQTTAVGVRHSETGSADEPLLLSFVPQGSMTAFVTLDDAVAGYADKEGDMLAAFIDDICTGKGEYVGESGGKPVYKLVISGVGAADKSVSLRYYSSRNAYVFSAPACLAFDDGKVVASMSKPFVVPLALEGKHPLRMKACVGLPHDVARYASADDMMAAFVGGECRGKATAEADGNGGFVFRMTVNGSLSAGETVVLRYYSVRNSYLYQSAGGFTFVGGGSYGSEAEPEIPTFVVVE